MTNTKTLDVVQRILRRLPKTDTGSIVFEKGSPAFSRIFATPFGLSKQRLLEQNADVFGKKEVTKILVERGGEENNLKCIALVIGYSQK